MSKFWTDDMAELIRTYDMLPEGCTVLCAVSGGRDSVFLLHELKKLSATRHFSLICVHYNHKLRGEESQRDATFVRDLCQQWQIPFVLGEGDVQAEAKQRKQGIEETARQMRYAFLYETAERLGADRIAIGHNADDNAETLLLHLTRGCGLQGLTGIAPRQGKLIRPILPISRAEICEQVQLSQLPYVEDSSNADDRLTRNRLRHQVIPVLKSINPQLVETMTANMAHFSSDNDYLNAQAAMIVAQASNEPWGVSISTDCIANAPNPIATRVLRQLLSLTPHGSTDCSAAHLDALLTLCRGDDPSAEVHLPHGLVAWREYGRLVLTIPPPVNVWEPFSPQFGETSIPSTNWVVKLTVQPWAGLIVRPRQTGDQITLPNGHSRSLKRLFIDRKIPRRLRETFPVVADNDGVIFAAPFGHNMSHPHHQEIQIIKKGENTHEHER